jgi:hypothetical protein
MKTVYLNFFKVLALLLVFTLIPRNDLFSQEANTNPLPQFLFTGFSKGIVQMEDGRKLMATLNYNMVDEEMIFQQGSQYMVLDKPEEIDTVYIQNRRFVYIEKVFYESVAKGTSNFFIQHKAKYVQEASNTAYGMKSPTNQNINVTTFKAGNQVRVLEMPDNVTVSSTPIYWVKISGEMKKFANQSQLLKLFPGNEDRIKEFIKVNNVDLKSREGLMNTGNFINSLEE